MSEITTNKDLYEILGCDELSSHEQIITEYKIRAKALHPDKNDSESFDTTEEFITLTKAKEILCDNEKRKDYDFWKHSGLDISFDVWVSRKRSNHNSIHWASEKRKSHMIEHDADNEEVNGQDLTLNTATQNGITKDVPLDNNHCKTSWRRFSGGPQLKKFRNYMI